jgi:hypothetical protein
MPYSSDEPCHERRALRQILDDHVLIECMRAVAGRTKAV